MTGRRASSLDDKFVALADPTRRRVIEALRAGEVRAGELAQAVDMSPPALSRHLRVLRRAGLVVETSSADDARVRLYRLEPTAFGRVRCWLGDVDAYRIRGVHRADRPVVAARTEVSARRVTQRHS